MVLPIADMIAPGLCPSPHVVSTVRVDRSEGGHRHRADEVLLGRDALEIAALSATINRLEATCAAQSDTLASTHSDEIVVRPVENDPQTPDVTRIMPEERSPLSQRPEIRQYVLPTVFSNNGSLIDVFA